MNVNTAPKEVLEAVVALNIITDEDNGWGLDEGSVDEIAKDIARSIVHEREDEGAFRSIDDLFDRVPEILGGKVDRGEENLWEDMGFGDHGERPEYLDDGWPNNPRRHAMARSLHNRITVSSDLWGVTSRVQIYEAEDGDLPEDYEILGERVYYTLIDRSFLPPRVLFRTHLALDR